MRVIATPPKPNGQSDREYRLNCKGCGSTLAFYSRDLTPYTMPRTYGEHRGQSTTLLTCPVCHHANHVVNDYNGWRHKREEDWGDYNSYDSWRDRLSPDEYEAQGFGLADTDDDGCD